MVTTSDAALRQVDVVKVSETTLPGVRLLDLEAHADGRGSLVEVFRADRCNALGIPALFVQDNLASSIRGALRGLHYRHLPQAKLVMVTRGEIYAVVVDVRRGSPTFGRWFGTQLAEAPRRQLWIPAGFAHGYQAVSECVDVLYKLTATFDPADDRTVRWDDPALAIPWPLTDPVLSARDAVAPLLADAELPAYTP